MRENESEKENEREKENENEREKENEREREISIDRLMERRSGWERWMDYSFSWVSRTIPLANQTNFLSIFLDEIASQMINQ